MNTIWSVIVAREVHLCVTMTIAMFSVARSRMTFSTSFVSSGSSALVGLVEEQHRSI